MALNPYSETIPSAKQVWINDQKLWVSFKNGELAAYEHLFRNYSPWLYNYGRQLGGDHELVKDVIQDFFGDLWQKRDKVSAISHIKPYLFKSFRRLLIKQLQNNRKLSNYQPEQTFQVSIETKIINDQMDVELKQKLQTAIQKLTSRQREALYLKFFEELSYEEISVAMGINLNTLYNTISSAIKNLKNDLITISLPAILFAFWQLIP